MAHTLNHLKSFPPKIALILLVIFCCRMILAMVLPLTFDEAYYWLWSRHLAAGYYDHPPMVAFIIRLGTMICPGTLGVRLIPLLLAIPSTWAVWRTAEILFKDTMVAARAALYFNLTILVTAETVIVTPDAPLLLAFSMTLFFLAKLYETGNGKWWLAIGIAVGCGLLSKYTAFFLGINILIWMLIVPQMRRWFLSAWPYLAGLLALMIFSPVIWWNIQHDYVSFSKQFGRTAIHGWTLANLPAVLPFQFLLMLPPVFILGGFGLWRFFRDPSPQDGGRLLLCTMILPLTVYFLWHSLHAEVEGNWFLPVYPAMAVTAAWASLNQESRLIVLLQRMIAPLGIGFLLLLTLQATLHLLPSLDRFSKGLGFGWENLAPQIETLEQQSGAKVVLTNSYRNTGWLSFYLPNHPLVRQINEPLRWINFDYPPLAYVPGPFLYITDIRHDISASFPLPNTHLTLLATLPRMANEVTLEEIRIYKVDSNY